MNYTECKTLLFFINLSRAEDLKGTKQYMKFVYFFQFVTFYVHCYTFMFYISEKNSPPIVVYKRISYVLSHIPLQCRAADCLPATTDFIKYSRPMGIIIS